MFEGTALVDDGLALETKVLAHRGQLFLVVAPLAQGAPGVLEEALVREYVRAEFTFETIGMPIGVHCFYNTSCLPNRKWLGLFLERPHLPMMNSLHLTQHGAKRTWKSCSQYFRPSYS